MTRLLAAYVVQQAHGTLPQTASAGLEASAARLGKAGLPVGEALLVLTGRMPTSAAAGVLEKVRGEDATIDRALALVWIHRALRGTPALTSALAKVALDGPWQDVETATGLHLYRWPNAAPPAALRLAKAPPAGLVAVAQFDSRDAEQSTLPVRVRRQLYRLVREPDQPPEKKPDAPAPRGQAAPDVTSVPSTYTLVPLLPEEALTTDQLYLDELTLTPANGARLRYGIVEVPLPPGATADRTTWGVALRRAGAEKAEALERARYEQTPAGYAVPIDLLAGETVVRHLVRVAEAGTFTLPPARYYRMYQPEQKAYEEAHRAQLEIR
jgi:hypothetical protein